MGCRSMRGLRSRRKLERELGHKRHGRQMFLAGLSQPPWRAYYATVREGSRFLSAPNRRLGAA